jgi:hypothetical protein
MSAFTGLATLAAFAISPVGGRGIKLFRNRRPFLDTVFERAIAEADSGCSITTAGLLGSLSMSGVTGKLGQAVCCGWDLPRCLGSQNQAPLALQGFMSTVNRMINEASLLS